MFSRPARLLPVAHREVPSIELSAFPPDTLTEPVITAGIAGVALLVAFAWSVWRCIHALHMLQLDSYSNGRFLKWLGRSLGGRLLAPAAGVFLVLLLGVVVVVGSYDRSAITNVSVLLAWIVGGVALLMRRRAPAAKKPLVFTGRAVRILSVALVLTATIAGSGWAAWAIGARADKQAIASASVLAVGLLLTQLTPMAVVIANLLLSPVQALINTRYIVAARRHLRDYKPIVIGITGSYGKTSTKYVVTTILQERFEVLMTPHSYNTLMGITRTINENLRSKHRIFVVEMGAYRPGDIRELAKLVQPTIGILTAIGPQHLDRFGSIERIESTKYELVQALPSDGLAVFNADDVRCAQLAERTSATRVARYGVTAHRSSLRVWAEMLETGPGGLSFSLVTREGGHAKVHTELLGRHNVLNVLAGVCVALEMGMSLEEIAAGIGKLEPAPHRLQRMAGAGGVTVIDDSYNSNVVGAMEALSVLESFTTGRRMLVTPGMVELGEVEDQANERFGARAAEVCDYIVLVGPRQTEAIVRGVKRMPFATEQLRVVTTLTEATAVSRDILRAGDVVLFENDLPDLYLDDLG